MTWQEAVRDAVAHSERTDHKWTVCGTLIREAFGTREVALQHEHEIRDAIVSGLPADKQQALQDDFVRDMRKDKSGTPLSPEEKRNREIRNATNAVVGKYFKRVIDYAFPDDTNNDVDGSTDVVEELLRQLELTVDNASARKRMASMVKRLGTQLRASCPGPASQDIAPVRELVGRLPEEPGRYIIVAGSGQGKTTLVKELAGELGFTADTMLALHGNLDIEPDAYKGICAAQQYEEDAVKAFTTRVKANGAGLPHCLVLDDVTLLAKKDEALDNTFTAMRKIGVTVMLIGHEPVKVISPLRSANSTCVLWRGLSADHLKTLLGRIALHGMSVKEASEWASSPAANARHVFCGVITGNVREDHMARTVLVKAGLSGNMRAPVPSPAPALAPMPAPAPVPSPAKVLTYEEPVERPVDEEGAPHYKTEPVIPYMGGKSRAADIFLTHVPKGMQYLVSPFAGGLSFECAWARANPDGLVIASDLDINVVTMYEQVQSSPDAINDVLRGWKPTKEQYKTCQAMLQSEDTQPVARAAAKVFVHDLGFSGMISFAPTQADSYDKRVFNRVRTNLSQFTFVHQDVMAALDSVGTQPGTFLYLDPPYVGMEDYYAVGEGFDHAALATRLRVLTDNGFRYWMMSYVEHPLLHELYGDWCDFYAVSWKYTGMNKDGGMKDGSSEVLIKPRPG
jgi:site-specific DNA-adenine methylase